MMDFFSRSILSSRRQAQCIAFLFFLGFFFPLLSTGQEVKLRIPSGGLYNTANVTCSPDGEYVLASHMDNTFNLWDVESGKYIGGMLYENSIANGNVKADFSPKNGQDPNGGKYYFTLGDNSTASLWETKTGNLKFYMEHKKRKWFWPINAIAFSPDAKNITSVGDDNRARIWDVETGKLLHVIKHRSSATHVAYNQSGTLIATASYGKKINLWDPKSGKKVKSFKLKSFAYTVRIVEDSNISGKSYLFADAADSSVYKWDIETGKLLGHFKGHKELIEDFDVSSDGCWMVSVGTDSLATIWNLQTNTLQHQIKWNQGSLNDVVISPDNKYFAAAGPNNSKVGFWNLESGIIEREFVGHSYGVLDLKFVSSKSVDEALNYLLLTGGSDGTAILFNPTNGDVLRHFRSRINPQWHFSYSNNSPNEITFTSSDSTLNTLNLENGSIVCRYKSNSLISALSSDKINQGAFLISGNDGDISKISLCSNHILDSIEGSKSDIFEIIHNFKGDKFLLATSLHNVTLWDANSNIKTHDLIGHTNSIYSGAFDKQNRFVVTCSLDGTTRVWNVQSGELIKVLEGNNQKGMFYASAEFSPDGNYLVLARGWGKMEVFDTQKWVQLSKIKLEGHNSRISSIQFSNDGKRLLTSGIDKTAFIWDFFKDSILHSYTHSKDVSDACFVLDEKYILTACYDGGIYFWDATSDKLVMKHYYLDSDPKKWVHLHSSGLFDASPEAMELMYWTKGLEVIEFAQLKDRYWLPGLWEKVMKGEALPDARNMQELKLQPEVELGELKDGKIPVTLTKREGGYGKVSILINGKEIQADARGSNFDKTKETQTIWIDLKDHPNLQNGENSIVVKASSEDGFVVGRPTAKKVTMSFQTTKPHFYAVVVGTGKYMNSSINLKYPEKDAESMSKALQLGSEKLFGKENTHIYTLTTSSTERPTKEKIKSIFTEIGKTAKSSDVVLVYLSGHGIAWGGDQGDFYYVTTDATAANAEAYNDEAIRKNYTVSTTEFTEYLKAIPANKQVMIIDACASGKAVDNLMASRDIDVSQIKAIDRMKDRTGMFVISGSAADAVSYEASRYGQGLLTYSILQAMKGAALRKYGSEEFFDVNLLFNYAREEVPKLAAGIGGIQTPLILVPKGGSFDIGKVDEETKKQIPLSNIKPVFVRTSFMDTEAFSDDLNLSKLLDDKLNQIAMRGADGQLVFLDTREFPDAYRLSGGYTQTNGTITLKLKIKGPKESEHALTAPTKEELVEKVIEFVERIE